MSNIPVTRLSNLRVIKDDANPYCFLGAARLTTDEITDIPSDGLLGGEIVYNTDLNDFQLYNGVWVNLNTNPSFLHVTTTGDQGTNISIGDHIKFNSIFNGNNYEKLIELDSTSPYVKNINNDSIGRIKLKAGKTYRISGGFGASALFGTASFSSKIRNADTGNYISPLSIAGANIGNQGGNTYNICLFSPTIDTRIELVTIRAMSTGTGSGNSNLLIEVV